MKSGHYTLIGIYVMTAVAILLVFLLAGCGGTARAQEKAPSNEPRRFKTIKLDDWHQLSITEISGRYLVCMDVADSTGNATSCDWDGLHNDLYNAEGKIR